MAAFGANSSSSSSACSASKSCSQDYDVFINHRGPDIKHTFATALHRNLEDRGVRAFLDESEMQVGDNVASQLEDAIRGSTVHVALFTKNYAKSNWCLDELCLMVESAVSRRTALIPVFHGVEPAHLRWTGKDKSGPYAEALREYEEKQRYIEKIEKWRNALLYVANISGLDLAAFNKGGELELLREVVERVVRKVPKPLWFVAKHPTGIQQKVEEFTSKVLQELRHEEEQAKVVGIVGSGGVGKTTMAKQFFNANRSIYRKSSFLADVAKMSLKSLQRQLIKDLKGRDIEIQSSEEGLGVLKTNLSNCNALIVLDDTDKVDQLEAFLPIKEVLHPNSLLLVTSRDKQVLKSADIEESFIYHLKELNTEDSRELFCRHAFQKQHILPPEFNDVVDGLSKACHGLPLALKVLGASLYGRNNISYWKDKLNGLDQNLDEDILKSLRVSYDSLNHQEKQIFLDIACFCVGEESDKWIKVWSGSGWQGLVGLETLQDKCLVELDTKNIIRMHDLLIHMGRNIAQEISLPIRIWRGTSREIFDLMEQSLYATIEVRGIRMVTPHTDDKEYRSKLEELLNSDQKIRIKKLQILEGAGDFVERMLKLKVLSTNLISLLWNNCRCSRLPSFPMQDLRVLEVNGTELGTLWEDEDQAPQQLLQLNIDAPLLELPKSLGKLRHLEKIIVRSTRLTKMPDSLRDLRNLQHIALQGCENLGMLPDSLGNLTNLRHLDLSMCKSLRVLPDSMEKLTKLEFINLDSCKNLEKLPNSLLEFPKIHCTPSIKYKDQYGLHIDLRGFPCLKTVPDSLKSMRGLTSINLTGCESLKSLPDFLGEFTYLDDINLRLCKSLEMLPDSLENLIYLHSINLSGCESLKRLPDSLGNLKSLNSIDLGYCKSLEMLPDSLENLKDLHHINLSGCESLKRLPDSLGKLKSLHSINLRYCKSLEMLPDSLESLKDLPSINLSGCESLKRLPDSLGKLKSLYSIDLRYCKSLEMLPDSLENLTSLHTIILIGCESLKRLPNSLGKLKSLYSIDLGYCKSLEMLPDSLENLNVLHHIDLSGCESLKRLPELKSLHSINLRYCKSLEMLPDSLENYEDLHYINLSGCESLKMLPDSLGKLEYLHSINLGLCKSLEMLPDSFENLESLHFIDLSGWKSLKRLPNSWPKLVHLHLNGCSSLTISSETLGNLSKLECLDLSGCHQMELLPPEVGRQQSLRKLNLFDTNIKELHFDDLSFGNLKVLRLGSPLLEVLPASLAYLKNLEELWLHGCVELQCLPSSIQQLNQLRELNIRKCGIQSLPAGVMEMTELRMLAVHRCPLRELPFGKVEGEKGLLGLKDLQLNDTKICEVSFPEGVCPGLQNLSITFCNDLVEVRALPTTLESLDLRGCRALKKTGGLCDLGNLRTLNLRGCDNIQVEVRALPTTLESLDLRGCRALMKTGGLCGLGNLRTLNLSGCDNIQVELQTLSSSDCRLLNTPLDASHCMEVFCNYLETRQYDQSGN